MRILHIADVHYRGQSRHDEYRTVFDRVCEEAKRLKVDRIFVGGDIFHTKTAGISPEYIRELSIWVDKLTACAPTVMILGNHDGNLSNFSRLDAVTPIVDLIKTSGKNIELYKDSGTYDADFELGDGTPVKWCVFSLFDTKSWDAVKPDPNAFNIACYHGAVDGCRLETGIPMHGSIDTRFFSEYDIALLGDIHKQQFLGYKTSDEGDSMPWIAYPGSTVQQNYGEDVDDHGFLLWDIESKSKWTCTFHKIANDHPYVTVPWTGDEESFVSEIKQYPPKSRFRIDKITVSDNARHIASLVKHVSDPIEITFKSEKEQPKQKSAALNLSRANYRDANTLADLVIEYDRSEFSREDVYDTIKRAQASIGVTDSPVGMTWTVEDLEFNNTFGYGEGNRIDFSKLSGLVGLFAPNRAGKSSIIGTLIYALYNGTDRGSVKNAHIVNIRKSGCDVLMKLKLNDADNLTISRQTTKIFSEKKGLVGAPTKVDVHHYKDGVETQLTGEQRSDTDRMIRLLIGTQDDFITTSVSTQDDISKLIKDGSTARWTYLSRYLDLGYFDKLHEALKNECTKLRISIGNYDTFKIAQDIVTTSDAITAATGRVEIESVTLSQLEREYTDFVERTKREFGDVVALELKKAKHASLSSDSTSLSASIQQQEASLMKLVEAIEMKRKEIDGVNVENLLARLTAEQTRKSQLQSARSDYRQIETAIDLAQTSKVRLKQVPCGGNGEFSSCQFIKDAVVQANKNFVDEQERISNLIKQLEIPAQGGDPVILLKEHDSAKGKILAAERTADSNRIALDNMKSKLAGIKKELELLGDVSDGGDTHAVSQTMAKMQADVKSAKNRHADAQKELGRIEAKLELLTQEYSKKEPLMKQLTLREYVSKAFSKKGVPSLLVREKLPLVNAEISNLLAGIVDFTIDLEADGDTNSLEIYINYGDSRRVIELSSGMERTIASIAIRTVLHGISILPKPDFMVIDEGFGTLDPAGVDSCIRLLRSISSRFRFLIVVSHVEQMKDAVDSCIEISKHEKDSYVNYIGLCRRSRRNDMAILQFTISMLHSVRHSYANTVDTLAMIHTISRSWNHMERAGAVTRLFTKRSRSVLEMIFSAA